MKTPSRKKVLMVQGNYNPSVHHGIARAAKELNWHLDISLLNSRKPPVGWQGDGIICSLDTDDEYANFVTESGLPHVDTSTWRQDLEMPRVSTNNTRIGELAAEHFLNFGHKTYLYYAFQETPWGKLRLKGFQQHLKKYGHSVDILDDGSSKDSEHILSLIRKTNKPAAIFTQNDFDAAWILNRCMEEGYKVPEDFAILGVDNNTLICETQPIALSSVSKDFARIAYEGCRLLERLMNGERIPSTIHYLEPEGVIHRKSTDALAVADPLIRDVLLYLTENLRHPIGIEDISRKFQLPKSRIEQRFREALRKTIHKQLVELRIKEVRKRLVESTDSVENIAAMTGFCHASHLNRVFKTFYKIPPLKYRKVHGD